MLDFVISPRVASHPWAMILNPFRVSVTKTNFIYYSCSTNLRDNFGKGFFIVDGDISKNLAINLDICFFQTIDKAAVRQTMFSSGCINTYNPQSAKLSFSLFAITISILCCFNNGLLGNPINSASSPIITFGFL